MLYYENSQSYSSTTMLKTMHNNNTWKHLSLVSSVDTTLLILKFMKTHTPVIFLVKSQCCKHIALPHLHKSEHKCRLYGVWCCVASRSCVYQCRPWQQGITLAETFTPSHHAWGLEKYVHLSSFINMWCTTVLRLSSTSVFRHLIRFKL